MIAVAGEVLIDLVTGPDGRFDARLGGGPYNAARSLASKQASTAVRGWVRRSPVARMPASAAGR